MIDLRPSPIAGTWYPGSPDALRESIDRYLTSASVELPKAMVIGVIAPHAGHRYSGHTAAYAFRCFEGLEPDIVALVSPLHSSYPGDVFTSGHDGYHTPFGEIPIAKDLLKRFADELGDDIHFDRIRHDPEHSLEIELPFLQRVLKAPFRLLPLMLLNQSRIIAEEVGHTLARVLKGHTALLVASSDLSHFYPAETARKYDKAVLARVEAFNPAGVIAAEEEGVGFACGRGAIAAVLWAARDMGADQVRTLAYSHSGEVTGDRQSVVGYGAAVILSTAQA
jgi:AmmeMemoRadiSam system protein B